MRADAPPRPTSRVLRSQGRQVGFFICYSCAASQSFSPTLRHKLARHIADLMAAHPDHLTAYVTVNVAKRPL